MCIRDSTDTVTMMSYGFDPYLSSWSPYHGAVYAVISSVAKIVAAGGDYRKIRFTFQEYFRRMSSDPTRWSQPFAALLGAYNAQMGFGLPSIGGKDSMSDVYKRQGNAACLRLHFRLEINLEFLFLQCPVEGVKDFSLHFFLVINGI